MQIIKHQASDETKKILSNVSSDYTKLKTDFACTLAEVKDGINVRKQIPMTKNPLKTKTFGDFDVHILGDEKFADAVIYLHGGGYLYGLDVLQYELCDEICSKCGLQIYILDYGLPFKYNWRHAYKFLDDVYDYATKHNDKIYMIGDSAGAGLALGFVQYLNTKHVSVPNKQVLISPWLDITMSNPESKKYEKDDPFLGIEGLIEAGKIWADGFDPKDYRLSPIFGDLLNMPETLISTGTREVMYPDIIKFSEDLENFGCKVNLIICQDSFHVYPFWKVPEAEFAIKQIIEFLV